jgi:ribosomal protein S18 acetylase RimI-like enzyme
MKIRNGVIEDTDSILQLYKTVAKIEGGISRNEDEVDLEYVIAFTKSSIKGGYIYVAEDPYNNSRLIACIHTYRFPAKSLKHTLGHLTIVVHPEFQGTGIGRKIFSTLLQEISSNRNDIARVELIARESNTIAISFYKTLGFITEGRFEKRILNQHGTLEADIPMAWLNHNYKP